MGILDNSGDIILDAVLTETGRKRMASGDFSIGWFAFGDDEINYGLYDLNHASGSAYYDLEILQTPIVEASTARSANINYGLTTFNNQRLLYLPVMERNSKTPLADQGISVIPDGEITYLCMNDGATQTAVAAALGATKVLLSGETTGRAIVMETGLQTTEIAATPQNRAAYLANQNLTENGFNISYDNRFFAGILKATGASFLRNGGAGGSLEANVALADTAAGGGGGGSPVDSLTNRTVVACPSLTNNIVYRQADTTVATTLSAISGPRANWTAFGLRARSLTTTDFTRHGFVGINLFADGNTYNYIDSEIQVIGKTTGIIDMVPIRIIKKV